MKIDFFVRFRTRFGQKLAVVGTTPALGNNQPEAALPMSYYNEDFWHVSLELDPKEVPSFAYQYVFTDENGSYVKDGETQRFLFLEKGSVNGITLVDSWNYAGSFGNAFYTAPFREVFFKNAKTPKLKKTTNVSHIFRVKAPLLDANECVCLLGSTDAFSNWNTAKPVLLTRQEDWWTVGLDLAGSTQPVTYKYGVYNFKNNEFIRFEEGRDRVVPELEESALTILHDGFVQQTEYTWKGSGVAIPVFSLRSNNSFGIGEFSDIKLLADWASAVGMKVIQLLPVNDTSATLTWKDSYPYAAISTFALHPIYINLQKVAGKKGAAFMKSLVKKQKQLNALPEVDYEKVFHFKMSTLRELYDQSENEFLKEEAYEKFYKDNSHWLVGYAAFCVLRDKYGTSHFEEWKTHSTYKPEEISKLTSPRSRGFKDIAFYYFVQYHLHLQLKEAADYAHKKGIAMKGDIPIGIYRYGCDAWTSPDLYRMDMQAGAPPDDFTIKGQNWGFPIYNWQRMQENHFEWWKRRFHQMSYYFDAFRIDHILGFFRIWSIPTHAVEGLMGVFVPALPLSLSEFASNGIHFDYDRFCKPFITDAVLHEIFGLEAETVKDTYLQPNERGGYDLLPQFDTQRKVEAHFSSSEENEEAKKLQQGLYDLVSNVLLFEEAGSDRQLFHFRILIEHTSSFRHLDEGTRHRIKNLYVHYFYYRHDEFWKKEALRKLPALKEATDMLICGEDLGMVPHCVPDVMKDLGILSLEIQRMPKNIHTEFFHPKDAPYLSVITPSTHDMSTIRGWWEENGERTRRFFHTVLGEGGEAPAHCEPWINRAIVLQHLYSPAMWSIFQLQDLLGMSETLRRPNAEEERINDPANPNHYWNYRMHLNLETLVKEKEFNTELRGYITNSNRG